MGHFGAKPIRVGWFAFVLPSLLLNYFGQGALLLTNPAAAANPLFGLAPKWGLLPARPARHRGLRHRLAGRHLGRLLADAPGDPARLHAAPEDRPHVREGDRADLPSLDQLGARARLHLARPLVPHLGRPRRGVRRRRDDDDGDHDGPPLRLRPRDVEGLRASSRCRSRSPSSSSTSPSSGRTS